MLRLVMWIQVYLLITLISQLNQIPIITKQWNSGKTDLSLTSGLANEIIGHLEHKDDLFIPLYDEVFSKVLERYHEDFRKEGAHSYDYKIASGRI